MLFFLLAPFLMFANTAITPYITSDDNTFALVDNLVNAQSGKLIQIDREISIRGSDPFELTRYYDNGHHFEGQFGYGIGVSLPIVLLVSPYFDTDNLAIEERIGSRILFNATRIKGKKKLEFNAVINPKIFSMGYTNCCQAQLRGESPSHATTVWGNEQFCIATLGDGTKRHYHQFKKKDHIWHYRLVREDRPNGNMRYFFYEGKTDTLTALETRGRTGTLVLHRVTFAIDKKQIVMQASNGQKVVLRKEKMKGKAKKAEGGVPIPFSQYVVKERSAPHLLARQYRHTSRGRYADGVFSLENILGGEGRDILVEYDKKDRVSKLVWGGSPLYTFHYDADITTVKNGLGQASTYHFSNKRLVQLKEPHKTQVNGWDGRGQLLSHTVLDPQGTFVHKKNYTYDSDGRITLLAIEGEMTEKGARDRYTIEYTHTKDELHLLQEEIHHGDITYRYTYLPGTNLRTSKIASKNNDVFDSEWYDYDAHGFLIATTHDDGVFRKITEIEPERVQGHHGLSQPKVIREYYIDPSTNEKKLLKKTERIYGKGDLVIEERVFDAEETFAYSKKWAYNDREELLSETNALGEVSNYAYDTHGNKIYEEKKGSSKRYTYNAKNQLIEEVERHGPRDFQTVHCYDAAGNKIVTRDRYCKTTCFHYDAAGRIIRKQDPYAYEESYALDTEGRITRKSDPEGHITHTRYNFYGSPLEILHPDGSTEHFRYDIEGRLIEKSHRDGSLEKHLLDERGRPLKIETFGSNGALLKTLIKEYKGLNLVREVDALGHETLYEYDGAGRKIKMIEGDLITKYRYDLLGRLSHTITPARVEVKLYDALDRVIEERTEDEEGKLFQKVQYTYDVHGNRIETKTYTSENEYTLSKELYDTQNRITHKIDPEGAVTEIRYHETDHLEVETIDPLGRRTVELHGACDEVREKRTYAASGEILASAIYEYNRLHKKILHKEKVFGASITPYEYIFEFGYDSMGQKVLEREAGLRTTTFTYDRGRLATLTKADGTTLVHTYDDLSRLASLKASDGTIDDHFSYDAADNCLLAENHIEGTATERKYDRYKNLIYEKQASGLAMSYSYDSEGRLLEASFLGAKILYTYNPAVLLTATRFQNEKALYTYHQKMDFKGKLLENGCLGNTVSYSWNKRGALTAIESPAFHEDYTYDLLGRMTSQGIARFTYDDLDQLIEETGAFDHTYAYDSIYNRRNKDDLFAEIDPLNQVASQGSVLYSYDAIGRRTTKDQTTYTYDALGRLLALKGPEGTFRFTYDPFGRRISVEENGQKSHLLYQFDAEIGRYKNGLKEFRALIGKESPFAIEIEGKAYFPLRNYRGDIVQLLSDSQTVFGACSYDSFGIESPTANFKSPWRFCGRRSFAGLLHFDKRDYDPALGRWLTPDPLGLVDGPNLYAYVKNSPLIYIDPYGLFILDIMDFSLASSFGLVDGILCGGLSSLVGPYQPSTPLGAAGLELGDKASWLPFGGGGLKVLGKSMQFGSRLVRAEQVTKKIFRAEQTINRAARIQGERTDGSRSASYASEETHMPRAGGIENYKKVDNVINVTPQGVAIPPNPKYKIPEQYVENPYRQGSYGEYVGGKFAERIRIDPATPSGMKGPNYSHYHRNGKSTHYSPRSNDPDPGFQP